MKVLPFVILSVVVFASLGITYFDAVNIAAQNSYAQKIRKGISLAAKIPFRDRNISGGTHTTRLLILSLFLFLFSFAKVQHFVEF